MVVETQESHHIWPNNKGQQTIVRCTEKEWCTKNPHHLVTSTDVIPDWLRVSSRPMAEVSNFANPELESGKVALLQ
jgi:hypothetical protein